MLDTSSQNSAALDVANIKMMLLSLENMLMVTNGNLEEDFNENISDEISIGNIDSDDLKEAAVAINRLSVASVNITKQVYGEDMLRDIADTAIRKTVEENEDLKRQIVLLQQKMDVKERHIQALENLLVNDRKPIFRSIKDSQHENRATQTDRCPRNSSLEPKLLSKGNNRGINESLNPQTIVKDNNSTPRISSCSTMSSSSSYICLKKSPKNESSSSYLLNERKPQIVHAKSRTPSKLPRKTNSPESHVDRASPTLSDSSESLSSSYFKCPRKRNVKHPHLESYERGESPSHVSSLRRINSNQPAFISTVRSSSSFSISSGTSSSTSTSYLPSPKQRRSQSSTSSRSTSPAIVTSPIPGRHQWLYKQIYSSPIKANEDRSDRNSINRSVSERRHFNLSKYYSSSDGTLSIPLRDQ